MEIDSTITVCCGMLTAARNKVLILSFAEALGAEKEVSIDLGTDPEPDVVRAFIYSSIGKDRNNADISFGCNYRVSLKELRTVRSLESFASRIRDILACAVADIIREEVLESITPPPPYAETVIYFQRQKVFLTSTGSRATDKHMVDAFDRYIGKRLYHEV